MVFLATPAGYKGPTNPDALSNSEDGEGDEESEDPELESDEEDAIDVDVDSDDVDAEQEPMVVIIGPGTQYPPTMLFDELCLPFVGFGMNFTASGRDWRLLSAHVLVFFFGISSNVSVWFVALCASSCSSPCALWLGLVTDLC